MRSSFLTFTALMLGIAFNHPAQAERLVIGTGGKTGVYYALGTAMCEALQRVRSKMECIVRETKGSVGNAALLAKGEIDIGILQSDVQYKAVNARGVFKKTGALTDLRALFSAHHETLAIVARRDRSILSLGDLPGNNINIGSIATGTHTTMVRIMQAQGWTTETFPKIATLTAANQRAALCNGDVAATAFLVGHPNALLRSLIEDCQGRLIDVIGPEIDRLIAAEPFYVRALIPKGAYPGLHIDIKSIGLLATVMARKDAKEELIYAFTSAVFRNLDLVKRKHRSLSYLQRLEMARLGMTAPRHPGAERYLLETGFLP